MDYKKRDQEAIEALRLTATLAFVGGSGRRFSPDYSLSECSPDISSNRLYLGTPDNFQTIHAQTKNPKPCGAAPWGDYRNWVPVIGGVTMIDTPPNQRRLPTPSDIVLIEAPVSVGGNGRISKESGGCGAGNFGGQAGDLIEIKQYVIYPSFGPNAGVPLQGSITNAESGSAQLFNTTTVEELGDMIGGANTWTGNIYPPLAVALWDVPLCHTAYFLDGSYICPDELNVELAYSKASTVYLDINFPCCFFGDSYISCKASKVRVRYYYNGPSPYQFAEREGVSVRMRFNNPLFFYGQSGIETTTSAVHPDYFVGYASEFVDPDRFVLGKRPSAESYDTAVNAAGAQGYVGGIILKQSANFYGDNKVLMVAAPSCVVNFYEETEFLGGCISNAFFYDNSVCPPYAQITTAEAAFFSRGPRITRSAIFRDASTCGWPLTCGTTFEDVSTCQIPCLGTTTFQDDSVYVWDYFMILDAWFFGGLTGIHKGVSNITPPINTQTIFKDNSICVDSKILTQLPTRFFGQSKIIIQKRFNDGNGYLPSNFTGTYSDSGKNINVYNLAGNGLQLFSPTKESDSLKHYCAHVHSKIGPRVALESLENKNGLVSCAPVIYAEFHDFADDQDWGNPDNWVLNGGGVGILPFRNTVVRIMAGKTVNNNSSYLAQCQGLIIEEGATVGIKFNRLSAILNYGTFSGKVNGVGDLFMFGNSVNIGTIKQATTTYFCDRAKNFEGQVDGFIRTGGLLVMSPRKLQQPIFGTLQAPAPVIADWSYAGENLFDSGPVSPEKYFYNIAHNCIGTYVYQKD